jgi:DNA repair protein RadD
MDIKPYDFQLETIKDWENSMSRRVCIVAPTGAGKTTIACLIIKKAFEQKKRSLFLVHRKELIEQCHDRLKQFGIVSGIIRADDSRHNSELTIQIASIPTLIRRGVETYPEADVVFVDEAHRVAADSYQSILSHYPIARIVGLTATPWRVDGRGLADYYDEAIVAAQYNELIALGIIVRPVVYTGSIEGLDDISISQGDYATGQLERFMLGATIVGDILPTWQKRANGLKTVVFATGIAHSLAMRDIFINAGIACEHVDGSTPEDIRESIIARWKSGETTVVTNCQIFTEGFDLPDLQCAIMARPTKSKGLYLQMVGRALRSFYGKDRAIILDHAGLYAEHGFPTDPHDYSLQAKKKTKQEKRAAQKEQMAHRMCPQCQCLQDKANSACIECGFSFVPLEAKSVELHEVRPAQTDICATCGNEAVRIVKPQYGQFTYQSKCFTCNTKIWLQDYSLTDEATDDDKRDELIRLMKVARYKNFKMGWAAFQYKALFGGWPSKGMQVSCYEELGIAHNLTIK